ncbi:hypothetical protein EROM_071650 [Encephalitozoon romaleae SJ-2008]|uniref:Mediator complex subunit 15 KIX domain-containing protein n=1 Tax=Encephalitozoon romaleae (strain SJ-2008) TaxID=1178016 RepID=I6ZUN0_ENCRO|nr:hypothetical protein EROM_071650 [Encephalitozoon romaleae SJ-2008]AFN83416.1 hypothetical protein EROM_071650 [Encephalitozoon romaleae SJ-2008]
MLSQEERKQMILKLFIALKESNIFPGYTPVQIKEAAIRAEQRIYEESNSKEEYLRGMGERFQRIERVVSNRNRSDGKEKNTQERGGPYIYAKPQTVKGQELGNVSGETSTSTKQDYAHGNGSFERGERRLSEQLFTENKHLFGKQKGFVPSEIMGISRSHGLKESDNISRFNDRDMEGSTRGRSNSCNIQGSLCDPMVHAIGGEGFPNNSRNPMFFRRPQSEVGPYNPVNRKSFQNVPDQRHFYMQRGGYQQDISPQSYRHANQGFGSEFSRFDYGEGNTNGRSKDENVPKSSIDMNFSEIQQSKLPGSSTLNGRGFVPLQYPQQFAHPPSSPYSNPGNMNMFPFSGKPTYPNTGPFGPLNHPMFGHNHSSRIQNVQGFPMSSAPDTISGFPHQSLHDRPTNMFSKPPQNRESLNTEWLGNPSVFDRHYTNPGQSSMKPSPIFFNQQVQHQPYFHTIRNPGQFGPGMDRKEAVSENSNQWMFGSSNEDPRIPYDEFLRRNRNLKKSVEYFSSSKNERDGFPMSPGEYKTSPSHHPSWPPNGFRSFFSEDSPPCSSESANLQKRTDNSPWFKEGALYNTNSEKTSPENLVEKGRGNYNVHREEESIEYNNNNPVIQHHSNTKEASQGINSILEPEKPFAFPSKINNFFQEHEMERIYLDYKGLTDLKSRLNEAISVIAKSQKIYNAFKEAFPGSELLQKYDVIKNLLEKQEEYLNHDAYFLKPRSIDGFIDQIKSLTIDMSHDLKLNTTDAGDVNYGECLMNAVKAFSERKKKEEGFGLNVVNEDAYE